MQKDRDKLVSTASLEKLADGFQRVNAHAYALLTRQVVVARRGRYLDADRTFIRRNLVPLVGKSASDRIAAHIARDEIPVLKLTPTASSHGTQPD
jgi:hypothetical protein